ncbi:myosin light chain 3, skeletal muscle isoform-like [Asterias rubens]|uniref:myosin light chain 3, skeletal muscle isoform-like n=1 Tax=Asterias rubens TaxID=7604 RepID=UPI001455611C|nr:myosin light chain 3, skeletal muscle isoform-like [Asterias rubens]
MSYSKTQLNDFQTKFALYDKRGDGNIGPDELGDALRACGLNPSAAEVDAISKGFAGKRLSFDEFLPLHASLLSTAQTKGTATEFTEGLQMLDRDRNNLVPASELRHVLTSLGEQMTEEEVDKLLKSFTDAKGMVNYPEFVKRIMSG